ncbi:hypothetical protein B0H14DRAFT_3868920 [Mycena olivaceomarginata]|nr:hypothetical protein B0H14DRAFT_3868920 [Mycena olivaceomarginata]
MSNPPFNLATMSTESCIHANHARHDQGSGLRLGKVPLCLAILFAVFRFRLPTLRIASAAILIGTSHLPLPPNAPRPRPYRPTLERKHPKLGLEAGLPVFILWTLYAFYGDALGRTTDNRSTSAIVSLWAQSASGANFLLKPAPPPMATISLYTTAPSPAQADEILDTHISILPFSPDLVRLNGALQQPNPTLPPTASRLIRPSCLRTCRGFCGSGGTDSGHEPSPPPHSTPGPHLILDATPQTVLQLQNTLRALIRSHLPPSTRRLTGLSDDMQFTPYLHRQRLRFVLALGGLSECAESTLAARVDTHSHESGLGRGAREARVPAQDRHEGDVYALPEAVQAYVLVQQIEDYAKAHFWVAVCRSSRCIASARSERRSAFWVTWCKSCGGTEEEEKVQKKIQELRDKDVVKRERGAECVKGIADLVLDNSGGLEEAWGELEGFVMVRMNA